MDEDKICSRSQVQKQLNFQRFFKHCVTLTYIHTTFTHCTVLYLKQSKNDLRMEKRTSKSNYVPILLHIVTSSSPTVLESSTMMVLTAPSNILIFWGFCFFLYSRISCSKTKGREKRTENKKRESQKEEKEMNVWEREGERNPLRK